MFITLAVVTFQDYSEAKDNQVFNSLKLTPIVLYYIHFRNLVLYVPLVINGFNEWYAHPGVLCRVYKNKAPRLV